MAYETFTRKIRIDAPREIVMQYWLMPGLVKLWFTPGCVYASPENLERPENALAEVGDKYTWTWVEGTTDNGTFRMIDFPRRFVAGWFNDTCEIEVTAEVEDDGTILSITQTNTQESEEDRMGAYWDCSMGWAFYLVNLKSVLEGGIDLRETNANIKGLVNY
jgi:uncharacterized protein YndB with AHSA1/START domain